LKRIGEDLFEFDKVRVEVINQSENVITGLRLRFDDVYNFCGFDISGTFFRKPEIDKYKESFGEIGKGRSIVLPELPAIPPDSSIEITLYGSLAVLKTSITTTGYSYLIENIVEVEDSLLLDWYRNPVRFVFVVFTFLPLLFLVLMAIWMKVRRRVIKNETKNILYNKACELAINGSSNPAMILLLQAVLAGYSNRYHALKDEDLESLRGREDFKTSFDKKDKT